MLTVEVRRARFGPGLWPGPRRQARWAGRACLPAPEAVGRLPPYLLDPSPRGPLVHIWSWISNLGLSAWELAYHASLTGA